MEGKTMAVTIPGAVISRRLEARAARVEALARIIMAEKSGFMHDPLGLEPHLLWWQDFVAQAEAILTLIGAPAV
jgi:hypothetical protein